MGLHRNGVALVDRRSRNQQIVDDVLEIRKDAMAYGLWHTTRRWKPRYSVEFIESVIFYRVYKSLIEGAAQYEAESDGD